MKELLIGMGIGFMAGAILTKTCKPFSNAVEKGVDKSKEIAEDIKEEIQSQTKRKDNENNSAN